MKRVLVHFFLLFAIISLGTASIRSVSAETSADDSRLNAIEQFEQYEEGLEETNIPPDANATNENTNDVTEPLTNGNTNRQDGQEALDSNSGEDGQNPFQEAAKIQSDIEKLVHDSESRSAFARFFIGSKYKELASAKQKNADLKREIKRIEDLLATISAQTTIDVWQNRIDNLHTYVQEAEERINRQEKAFSLFGWLIRLIST